MEDNAAQFMSNTTFVLLIVLVLVIGIPLIVLTFFVCRRLHEMHTTHNTIEGELFVSDDGGIFSEFGIPVTELCKREYILLKVHHIKPKVKEDPSNE